MASRVLTKDQAALRRAAHKAHTDGAPDAVQAYAAYLAQVPEDGPFWSNLGALFRKQGQYHQALRAQARAQRYAPNDVGLRNNYANILSDLGHYNRSIAARRWILEQRPDDANQKAMIGRCLRGQGDYRGAIDYLSSVIPDHPDDTELQMQLAFAQLGAGLYNEAFDTYRARWNTDELTPRKIPFPEWAGEPLQGKTILVLPEQGFGDAILFMRFLPALKALGATVWVLAEKPVYPLFKDLETADWVGTTLPPNAAVDCWINLMDMARVHFADTNDVPAPTRLAIPDDANERAAAIVAPFKDVMKVGVVWTGSVTYKGNGFRSFSHTEFLPLADIPGVQLFSLYKGPELAKFHADGSDAFIVDTAATERNFGDSAAMMQQMDLVISSDTATAHLAGSLGVPTWTILHWDPFWVWRHAGDTTDWYPGMRLFRQGKALEWTDVLAEVGTALRARIGDRA
ncbi:tetratricopeptide repeat-containing glycosyltransferase family protein [Rhodobacteraceae bacterium S2214]|nr:tetratricopeptide repeat-containing glycosyltransferase family protein [Rhodobacteraceae bacterium S2214]